MSRIAIGLDARDSAEAHAIRLCLDELGAHAEAQGLALAANLIGAASRAISDEILRKDSVERLSLISGEHAIKTKT